MNDAFARLEVAVFQLRLPRIQADRLVRSGLEWPPTGSATESVILRRIRVHDAAGVEDTTMTTPVIGLPCRSVGTGTTAQSLPAERS